MEAVAIAVAAAVVAIGGAFYARARKHGFPGRPRSHFTRAANSTPSAQDGPPTLPIRILCVGDSLTDSSYPKHLGVALESLGVAAEVHGVGLPGHTSRELLSALDGIDLDELEPELVLLLIGTNDSRVDFNHVPTPVFIEALNDLVTRLNAIRFVKWGVALCTLPPVVLVPFHFSADSVARIDSELNPAIREVGRLRRVPVIDLAASFQKEWLLPGDVHPSETGYREMGRIIAEAIAPWLRLIAPLSPTGQVKSAVKIMAGQ